MNRGTTTKNTKLICRRRKQEIGSKLQKPGGTRISIELQQ